MKKLDSGVTQTSSQAWFCRFIPSGCPINDSNSPRYLYLWGVLSTTQIIWLFRDGRQTDRQIDLHFFWIKNFRAGGKLLIVKALSLPVEIRV